MAYNTLTDLNNYAQGNLFYDAELLFADKEGGKKRFLHGTWDFVRQFGDPRSGNLTVDFDLVYAGADPSANIAITFDDYDSGQHNTSITTNSFSVRNTNTDTGVIYPVDTSHETSSVTNNISSSLRAGTVSFWIKLTSEPSANQYVFSAENGSGLLSGFNIFIDSNMALNFYGYKGVSNGWVMHLKSPNDAVTIDQWHHVVMSYDRSSQGGSSSNAELFIDGTSATLSNIRYNDDTDGWDTAQEIAIHNQPGGDSDNTEFQLIQFWLDTTQIDVTANLAKFYDSVNQQPVDMGTDGTGSGLVQPLIYHYGNASTWVTNNGRSSGDYITYTLTAQGTGIASIDFTYGANSVYTANVAITDIENREDWIASTMYLNAARDWAGNLDVSANITNSATPYTFLSDSTLEWIEVDEVTNTVLADIVYDYEDNLSNNKLQLNSTQTTNILDYENPDEGDEYTMNINTGVANLRILANGTQTLNANSVTNSSNVNLIGTKTAINNHLDNLEFYRAGDLATIDKHAEINWQLTNPTSGEQTQLTQVAYPEYTDDSYSEDKLVMRDESTAWYDRNIDPNVAYVGVDDDNSPLFVYAFNNTGNVPTATTHKVDYTTGNLVYGNNFSLSSDSTNYMFYVNSDKTGEFTGNTATTSNKVSVMAHNLTDPDRVHTYEFTIEPNSGMPSSTIPETPIQFGNNNFSPKELRSRAYWDGDSREFDYEVLWHDDTTFNEDGETSTGFAGNIRVYCNEFPSTGATNNEGARAYIEYPGGDEDIFSGPIGNFGTGYTGLPRDFGGKVVHLSPTRALFISRMIVGFSICSPSGSRTDDGCIISMAMLDTENNEVIGTYQTSLLEIAAFEVVPGHNANTFYLFFTKPQDSGTYPDVNWYTSNHGTRTKGLFYYTVDWDGTGTPDFGGVSNYTTVVSEANTPEQSTAEGDDFDLEGYGWVMGGDSATIGSNTYINIIVSGHQYYAGGNYGIAYPYGIKVSTT